MTAIMHPTSFRSPGRRSSLGSAGAATTAARSGVRLARIVILAVGPVLSVWAISAQTGLGLEMVEAGMWVGLAFWTPLFPVSFPALLLQDARDDALSTVPVPLRWVLLLPWLALAPRSAVKTEMWANVAGVAVAAWWLLGHLPA
jgi:pimeloyl-ACP methyl ester carboxylesterase